MKDEEKLSEIMNLIGYGLAKFDLAFVKEFGFETKTAFYKYCVELGLAKTIKSVSNRQDSFDPYFDNGRRGWYQRNQREHIKLFIDSLFGNENVSNFADVVKMYIQDFDNSLVLTKKIISPTIKSRFKQLQETGKEAEFYFMQNYQQIHLFQNKHLEDARCWGDGYDFQIQLEQNYALLEVKGLRETVGAIRMTQNEFEKATEYKQNYFLIVVSNLSNSPKMNCVQNPIQSIKFTQHKIETTQINYHSENLRW